MEQRLLLVVESIVKQCLEKEDEGWSATPDFVLLLTETIQNLCKGPIPEDLLAFSQHAKHKTIGLDDVRLLVRKSPQMIKRIDKLASTTTTTTTTTSMSSKPAAASKRKTQAPANSKRPKVIVCEEEEESSSTLDEEEEEEAFPQQRRQQRIVKNDEEELFND